MTTYEALYKAFVGPLELTCLPGLHLAALTGDASKVEEYLGQGQNVNVSGENYGAPLHAAAINGDTKTAKVLIDKGAIINASGTAYYGSPLQTAAMLGNDAIVTLLLAEGANINDPGAEGHGTPLQSAARSGHLTVVKLLLQKGANPNSLGKHPEGTALHAAALNGHEETVKLLLDNGASINAECENIGTPLQAAASHEDEEVALTLTKLLLAKGASINAKACGAAGNALTAAVTYEHEKVVQLLLDCGANVNATGGDYGSPLCAAAVCEQVSIAKLLRRNGAEIDKRLENLGGTADYADWNKDEDVEQFLRAYGHAWMAYGNGSCQMSIRNE
ncbi:hypothetical protein O988_06065 [Pseudogymnoascus sp. VKM F-3808]|nr:hypothetical protein O988_06065 [Pseudogymnoascus sp. VKM F-3808]